MFGLRWLFSREHDAQDFEAETPSREGLYGVRLNISQLSDEKLIQDITQNATLYLNSKKGLEFSEKQARSDSSFYENNKQNIERQQGMVKSLPRGLQNFVEEIQYRLEEDGVEAHPELKDMAERLSELSASDMSNPDTLARTIRSEQPNTSPSQHLTM